MNTIKTLYNYSKLNKKIAEKCGSQSEFAKKIGLSQRSISLKLNNKRGWKQDEMGKVCTILDIPINKIPLYFFEAKD